MLKVGGVKTVEVNHFEYWWLPMLNIFSWDGLTMRRIYRQKKTTYLGKDCKLVVYELEIWQR